MKFLRSTICIFIVDIQKYKLYFRYNLFKKILFMHFIVLAIFRKYCIRHILCEHSKIVTIFHFGNVTIFPRNIFTIFSKYFGAVWVN